MVYFSYAYCLFLMDSNNYVDGRVDRLIAEVQSLTAVVKDLIATTPQRNKIWLSPSEIGRLLGVSARHIGRYREQGVFKTSSFRKKGNRFEYHCLNALQDAQAGGAVNVR